MARDNAHTPTELRQFGNQFFAEFKKGGMCKKKIRCLHTAIGFYEQSIYKCERNDHSSRASAYKNMGVCYAALETLETQRITELSYLKRASYARARALEYGELASKDDEWKREVACDLKATVERYVDRQTGLLEDTLQEILSNINVDVQWQAYHDMICQHRIDQGERILNKSMQAVSDRNYKTALPALKGLYCPIEEAKKHAKNNKDMLKEVAILEEETLTFQMLAEGLQSFFQGVDELEKVNKTDNGLIRTEHAYRALDYFKNAELLSRGEDVELVAMSQAKTGMTLLHAFKLKARAKLCFVEALEVSTTVVGNVHSRAWYIELKETMQKIRDEEIDMETRRWENKKKPYMEELKPELKKLKTIQNSSSEKIIDFIWENFPPKHKENVTKPNAEDGSKAILRLILIYHPDKIDENKMGVKYKALCEEITKILNNRYHCP